MTNKSMRNKEQIKKWQGMKDADLEKEIQNLQKEILLCRIDIANRKTKGIRRIRKHKRDIARIKTVISQRKGQNE